MATVINAQTSAGGLSITPDLSGQIALQSNGTTVATITPTGVTTQVGAPAFSSYLSTNQTISNGTYTKIAFNTKEFDTNSNFDATTNYRFTPTVAGYYQINGSISINTATQILISIYKNGGEWKRGENTQAGTQGVGSAIVYCNGSVAFLTIRSRVRTCILCSD